MSDRATIEATLRRLGDADDASFELFEAALLLGALDRPDADADACRAHVKDLVERLAGTAESAAEQARALAHLLHDEAGYEGDRETYDHPDNANLVRVIERRRGLPVALGILYIHVAERAGLNVAGLNVPGHFVVRLSARGERVILDPFHNGAVVDTKSLRELVKSAAGPKAELLPNSLQDVSKRAVVLRLQNNLKTRALAARQLESAATHLTRMTLIAPAAAELWFELGVVEEQLDHLSAALSAYTESRDRARSDGLRISATTALTRLRRRLN